MTATAAIPVDRPSYHEGKRLYRRLVAGDLSHLAPVLASLQPLVGAAAAGLAARLIEAGVDADELLVRATLAHHVRRPGYLERMAAPDSMRHDLDGNPVEPVSARHRDHAAATRKAMGPSLAKARQQARRRTEREARSRWRATPAPVVEVKQAGRRRLAAPGGAGQGAVASLRDRLGIAARLSLG